MTLYIKKGKDYRPMTKDEIDKFRRQGEIAKLLDAASVASNTLLGMAAWFGALDNNKEKAKAMGTLVWGKRPNRYRAAAQAIVLRRAVESLKGRKYGRPRISR